MKASVNVIRRNSGLDFAAVAEMALPLFSSAMKMKGYFAVNQTCPAVSFF
jgi:hypothetical protein